MKIRTDDAGAMCGFDPADNPFGLPELSDEDVDRLHGHVEALANEHGLDWRQEDIGWLEAEGAVGEDWFESPVLHNEFSYLVALHEIGHHVLNLPSDDEEGNVIFENEVDVWRWALDAAVINPSEGARAQIRLCLATYPEQPPPPPTEVARLSQLAPPNGDADMTWRTGDAGGLG